MQPQGDCSQQTYPTLVSVGHAGTPVAGAVGALLRGQAMGLGRLQHVHELELEGVGQLLALDAADTQAQALNKSKQTHTKIECQAAGAQRGCCVDHVTG